MACVVSSRGSLTQQELTQLGTFFPDIYDIFRKHAQTNGYQLRNQIHYARKGELENVSAEVRDRVLPKCIQDEKIVLMALDEEKTVDPIRKHLHGNPRDRYYRRDTFAWDQYSEPHSPLPAFLPVPVRYNEIKTYTIKTDDGEEEKEIKVLSQYGESTIKYFGAPIDLTHMDLHLSLLTPTIIHGRQSDYHRTNKFEQWTRSRIHIDQIGSFSCIGPNDTIKEEVQRIAGSTQIKTINIDSLYRGGNGKAEMRLGTNRAKKIVKGASIFPFLMRVNYVDPETMTIKPAALYCLAIFDALDKVLKYRRSRDFIPELLTTIERWGGLKLFNPEKYEEEMEKKFGKHRKYWDGLGDIWKSQIPEDAEVMEIASTTEVTTEHLAGYIKANNLSQSTEITTYKCIKDAHDELTANIEDAKSSLRRAERNLTYNNSELNRVLETVKRLQENVAADEATKDECTKNLQGWEEANITLSQEFNDASKVYSKFLESVGTFKGDEDISSSAYAKWLANINKQGIVIEEVIFYDGATRKDVSLRENGSMAFEAKYGVEGYTDQVTGEQISSGKRFTLKSVTFSTMKPVIIRVDYDKDGENCKKIVGGPYRVEVTDNSLNIALTSTNSCFGYNMSEGTSGQLWIHPHTSQKSIATNSWRSFSNQLINVLGNACLGEASAAIYNGFKEHDIKMVIYAAMSWVTSANSTDAWGKHWKKFPKLEDVYIEGRETKLKESDSTEEQPVNMSTEEGMDILSEIAEDLIENLSQVDAPLVSTEETSPEVQETPAENTETEPATIYPDECEEEECLDCELSDSEAERLFAEDDERIRIESLPPPEVAMYSPGREGYVPYSERERRTEFTNITVVTPILDESDVQDNEESSPATVTNNFSDIELEPHDDLWVAAIAAEEEPLSENCSEQNLICQQCSQPLIMAKYCQCTAPPTEEDAANAVINGLINLIANGSRHENGNG